jgi:hypothetical protein
MLMEWEDPHDENPDHKTKQSAKYECKNIQLRYFIFYFLPILYTISIVQKIKQILFSVFHLHSQL